MVCHGIILSVSSTVIKIVFEILECGPKPIDYDHFEIRLNHSRILNAVLSFCKIPKATGITSLLEQLNKPLSFHDLKAYCAQKEVPKESVDALEKFCFTPKSLDDGLSKLEAIFGSAIWSQLQHEQKLLRDLHGFLQCLGVRSRINLIPLLSYNASYYEGGIMFQVTYANRKKLGIFFALSLNQKMLTIS